jgi:hypothetical protein
VGNLTLLRRLSYDDVKSLKTMVLKQSIWNKIRCSPTMIRLYNSIEKDKKSIQGRVWFEVSVTIIHIDRSNWITQYAAFISE